MKFDNKEIKKFYELHIKKFSKEDIRAMGWFDEEEYSIRFEVVSNIIKKENCSILDVGCGFGGLFKYLNSSGKKFEYLGIDIVPKMIEIAKEDNPTGNFKVADILSESLPNFDYVFCVGALNIKTQNFDQYFMEIIKKIIEKANIGAAINFLTDKHIFEQGPYHFEDPYKLKKILEKECQVKVDIILDPQISGESTLFAYKNHNF